MPFFLCAKLRPGVDGLVIEQGERRATFLPAVWDTLPSPGDIKVIGPRPDGSPWRIGIRHPRRPGALIQAVSMRRGGLASSGDYERCIVLDGVRYGHILNPRTGWPVRHLASVSVVGVLCLIAGSASTIAMLKEDNGPAWLEGMGLPHFWVDVHGETGGSLAAKSVKEEAVWSHSAQNGPAFAVLNEF